MSKTKTPTKKKKTRLKGTDTKKPCQPTDKNGCGKMKDRFKDFKPRWAGCADHRTARGRRFNEPGCAACSALVNGNIRQPRCIECDSKRVKKRKKTADPKPTTVETPKAPTPVVASPQP